MKKLFSGLKNLNWAALLIFIYLIAIITYQTTVIILRAVGTIDWHWAWVLFPLEFCAAGDVIGFMFVGFYYLFHRKDDFEMKEVQ